MVAARLLVAYHLAHQRADDGRRFSTRSGIAHEDGLIADEEMKAPPRREAARGGRARIGASYPADDVALYLSTLIWQDPETWGALAELPETRAADASKRVR